MAKSLQKKPRKGVPGEKRILSRTSLPIQCGRRHSLIRMVGTAAVKTAEHGRHLIRAATVPAKTRRSFVAISKHYRSAG